MTHPLCNHTVTLYRKEGGGVVRKVITDCYYRYETALQQADNAPRLVRPFRLLTEQEVKIGDRIFPGEGPEIAPEDWQRFIPESYDGLSQVEQVRPRYVLGQLWHYDAGC